PPSTSLNTHRRVETNPIPIIGVPGLLGLVALVDKLKSSELAKQKEATCPTSPPPPVCSQKRTHSSPVGDPACESATAASGLAQPTGHSSVDWQGATGGKA
ncbi:MAG: hypothetical protein WBA76_13640, partial [Phormidesmis sp.]